MCKVSSLTSKRNMVGAHQSGSLLEALTLFVIVALVLIAMLCDEVGSFTKIKEKTNYMGKV